MSEVWFSYGSIRYSLEQIFFLLENKSLLESGHWVPRHIETGYIGSSKGRKYNTEGYFVKAVVIIAELNLRLNATGLDGILVVERYNHGYDEGELADRYKMDYYEVIDRLNSALSYCRGSKRKDTSYENYKYHRDYQKEKKYG